MAVSVVMPALEMAQETGKLVAWRKKEGESVAKGEPLLEVETDKAVMEIEAPADGVLTGVKVQEGDVVPVGQTIAWIVRPGEVPPPEIAPPGRGTATETTRPAAAAPTEPSAGAGPKISPKARRLAREHGVELNTLRGSGPDGAIVAEDVLARVGPKASPGSADAAPVLSPVARLMAERTTHGWTTVPHFFLAREVDASALLAQRQKLIASAERTGAVRPTYTDLLIVRVARVLVDHPRLNASWTGDSIRLNPEINISVAVAVKDGVVGAVLHKADKTELGEIAHQRRDLGQRARAGRLRPADLVNGTFTISNLGMYNVDAFIAIITPPQAAVLAVGRIADRVVPVLGRPIIRPMMTLTLSCDHRVVDGAEAALFLNQVAEAISAPDGWPG